MTSCGTRFIGPNNEILYEVRQTGDELQRGLQHVDLDRVRGPSSHTSVMFRREAFEKVGGYRAQFDVAQDLDLWMRLAEVGLCWATPEVHCEFHLDKSSISVVRKAEQLRAAKLIMKCAAARRSGRDDSAVELHPLDGTCCAMFIGLRKDFRRLDFIISSARCCVTTDLNKRDYIFGQQCALGLRI